MVKFTTILAAVAATMTGVNAFDKPCNAPYDFCGWMLSNSEFGYKDKELQDAAREAGQDWTNGTILYDSIYNCGEGGAIAWNRHCERGCNPPLNGPNANCRA
ncbi:hypothetical protein VTJ49DRAFT_5195 [Mycothermus thermophilus]|uniref:Uncharacterized protein n=1 Tax=Humicola insolens TaxID=85995 RepID=A0ABR3VL73_HUMIN